MLGVRQSVELTRARKIRSLIDKVDFLFDIHSMQHKTAPLMLAGPLRKGRALARALGYPKRRIILRHLIPNALGPVIVAATLGIVRSHDGAVDVSSTVGKGTTVTVILPATDYWKDDNINK